MKTMLFQTIMKMLSSSHFYPTGTKITGRQNRHSELTTVSSAHRVK